MGHVVLEALGAHIKDLRSATGRFTFGLCASVVRFFPVWPETGRGSHVAGDAADEALVADVAKRLLAVLAQRLGRARYREYGVRDAACPISTG